MKSETRKVVVRGRILSVHRRKMSRLFGVTYKGGNKILVEKSLIGIPMLGTIVHEMVHNLNWGLSESRTLHLEYALVTMVMSNPELFAELAEHAPIKPKKRPQ